MSIQINVKDLPEHCLKLTASTDPSFEEKLSAVSNARNNSIAQALMPYSVLLENTGNKTIVAYRLKFEMTRLDGTVSVRHAGGATRQP